MRYAYELAGDDAVVKRAKALQDVLGEHQDSVVAEATLRGLPPRARARVAAGRLIERERGKRARRRAPSWREAWRRLERAARDRPRGRRASSSRDGDVLLVHRPRYDDWTFPKGKADEDESDEDCALREVHEETGLRCALDEEIGVTEYVDAKGRPKRVRWWRMHRLADDGFRPNDGGRRAALARRGRRRAPS